MKKQIITLTMCLALSTACTLAQECSNTIAIPQVKASELARREQARKCFEERMSQKRENLYTNLGLSEEQKAKARCLDKENKCKAEPLMKEMHRQKIKLYELKAKNASEIEICKQKHEVKLAKKALKQYFKEADKNFEAILTKEQLLKFQAIKKQRKAEMKKHSPHSHKGCHKFMPPGSLFKNECPKTPCKT